MGLGDASLTIFVNDFLQNQKNSEKTFLETENFFFEKVAYL